MLTFFQYPKCSTCRKAKQFLDSQGIVYENRHIVEEPPKVDELRELVAISGLPVQKFFNTSGQVYRQMELSKQLPTMSEEEKLQILASNGMLVKRPILTDGNQVTIGFKEEEWQQKWT
ncbi:arsenate reductase family protein [Shimazuella kribbensis]|uniref:arsenate reductase family protein n=1 Tax=Shimazuella kribbensis TaxID=139808 RepID=UPI00041B9D28|nr:arsenate reductase family protein [Shimazuella kribbensis]